MSLRYEHGSMIDLEDKAVHDAGDHYTVTGYGAVFNNTDLGNDVILPGAFSKSLREHGLPLFLFNHKMDDAPIGTVVDAKEDKKGLWYKSHLPKDDSFVSGRIIPQLKMRGIKSNSIGYKPTQKSVRKDGVRELKEIRLYEISVVNLPMNPLADVESVKGLIPFQDHFVDRNVKTWDAEATFKKLVDKFGGDVEQLKQFFIWVDEEKAPQEWDAKLLIADIDDKDRIATNHIALYKVSALIAGARGGIEFPSEVAETAVKETLDRYYSKLDLDAPFKSLSADEYENLDSGELEARLKGLGISRKLATRITGLRDADRKQAQRDAVSKEDATSVLLEALAKFASGATAIKAT